MDSAVNWTPILLSVGVIFAVIVLWSLVGYPKWRVWASHQRGLADLAQANNEQQIQIAKARARKEATSLNKEAAIIEAEGSC